MLGSWSAVGRLTFGLSPAIVSGGIEQAYDVNLMA